MKRKYLIPILISIVVSSCGKQQKYEADAVANEEKEYLSTNAASGGDSSRQFIRTADLKLKVKNVIEATYFIEKAVRSSGGFVTFTDLRNSNEYTNEVQTSPDSVLNMHHFTMSNTMTIRLPNTMLDQFLLSTSSVTDHMEHRTVKAEDVTLNFLSDKMALQRAEKHGKRIRKAIDEKGKDLSDIVLAEETLASGQELTDENHVASLSMADKVAFSTIEIYIYQNPAVFKELVFNPALPAPYEPNLLLKIKEAFISGWKMLEAVLVFFVSLWGFILTAILILMVIRKTGILKQFSGKRINQHTM